MNNSNQIKKSFFKRFWWVFLVGIIVILGAMYIIKPPKKPEDENNVKSAPVLTLSFSDNKYPDVLMPMGETLKHPDPPNPGGHPGIDFEWNNGDGVKILASMDAEITNIKKNDRGGYDLSTAKGGWGVDYTELESVNPEFKVGSQVKVGDFIGIPNNPNNPDNLKFRMIHWQFGYAAKKGQMVNDRLCPLTFFDTNSRTLIENLWTNTNWSEMKANAPELCSGYYKGRDK